MKAKGHARKHSPPQPRRGGRAEQEKTRSHISPRGRGGVGQKEFDFLTNTTPSAPVIRMLRDTFLDVAATPPQLRRGMLARISALSQEGVTSHP
jgi:hypothetical protein